jgi:proline iminopeptidase
VISFGKEAPVSWYERLADHNFDVYIYDQVGSGLSARLADPEEYSVARHVADLEAIRTLVGNRPCILIGDSWGATLASHYMARYPENVAKAILTAPGGVDLRDWNEEFSAVPRFPLGWYEWIRDRFGEVRLKRYVNLDHLMQHDIHQAYAFAGDRELDALADEFISAVILKTCVYNQDVVGHPDFRMRGMGFWAMSMTIWDLMNLNTKPVKDALRSNPTPVLVLRGDADYLPAGIADEYDALFPNARLIRIPRCGHFIWLDQPEIYARSIETFLFDESNGK